MLEAIRDILGLSAVNEYIVIFGCVLILFVIGKLFDMLTHLIK